MSIISLFKRHRQKPKTAPAKEKFELVLSGSGGQGILLAGKILANAASIYDNKEAVMSTSYGPEARGGASKTEVIISSEKIDYPKVIHTDTLLAMTQESLDKYGKDLDADNGLLIVDEVFTKDIPKHFKNVFSAPFTGIAIKMFNAKIVANIIALGALTAITKVVSREALIRAVLSYVPEKALVLDRVSIDVGFKIAEDSGFKWRKKV